MSLLRPYGLVIDGVLEIGLEVLIEDGVVREIRPHTGIPDDYVLSPAFVNAHSHLEYRGFQGVIAEHGYWEWIRELTRRKSLQTEPEVRNDCLIAAKENRSTGVAVIGEHSDRPFAGEAMAANGLAGVIFQEIITFFERETRQEKLAEVRTRRERNAESFQGPVFESPHAFQTVDPVTLREIGASGNPFSMHVAETPYENALTLRGDGPIADFYRTHGLDVPVTGERLVRTLANLGLVRSGAQFVHGCDLNEADIALLGAAGVTVAHCPRSNLRLRCPAAPVREMLDAGVVVGLGMDSPASSGEIDMFAEMRAALHVSLERGRPLEPEEAWQMATSQAYASLPLEGEWGIRTGGSTPMIRIHVSCARCTGDLIDSGSPSLVEVVGLPHAS